MRRAWLAGQVALGAGVLSVEGLLAYAYQARGTWWHFLLHQYVGWGLGLSVAALLGLLTRRRVPVLLALLGGQLVSIVPDLMFRYLRMPHEPAMDVWVGHISLHRGPTPVLVATAVLLLGALAWFATARALSGGVRPARSLPAVALALLGPVLLTAACLTADPIPTRLSDYPADSATVVPR